MKLIIKTVSFFVICLSCTVTADTNTVYSVPDAGELSAYDPPEVTVIQSGHGDAEIVLGWWGWPGAKGAPSALQKAARQAVADPDQSKYSFEYDAASWQFYDKYYPRTVDTIKKAVALGPGKWWEVHTRFKRLIRLDSSQMFGSGSGAKKLSKKLSILTLRHFTFRSLCFSLSYLCSLTMWE